ncbi:hypothetical protein [Bifidobacterium cuniculi]|uniref:ABC transporter ATP-binding protein n=1 Tax=Bifidobacterium cuniculi TaxID=1688 RepID=A0A087AQ99_9BIFI|nr:hypothetical protein [Bifidobacterium cuniculi]KFI60949.1 ABC transporter ATP-binding protein [Bifidobacterium cuniculi]
MRLRSILSEAMRNIGTGTAHALLLFVLVALSGTLLGGYEAATVTAQEREALTRVQAYADVDTVVGGTVDGAACDALAQDDAAFGQSGALRAGDEVALASTPGKVLQTYEVTPGMLALVAAGTSSGAEQVDASGVWVPQDVANDFGLVPGASVMTDHGAMDVAGVYEWPNDGRDTRFAYTFLVPQSTTDGTYHECWAKQWPHAEANSQLLYATLVAGQGQTQAGIMAINKGFDSHYDAAASYVQRVTRWMPWLGLVLGVAIGVLAVRRRRLEYAGALHSGQSKGAQLCAIAIEAFVWAGLGALCACALIVSLTQRTAPVDAWAVCATALRTPLAVAAGSVATAVLTGLTIRQSQLFKLFKRR